MRLINVSTKTLEKFDDDTKPIPPYAILSHTWGLEQEEISFKELQEGKTKAGNERYKFDNCCAQAARDGLPYVWIDTCCIDQMNSTELSEAVNSMFKWYKDAKVCYAYLRDVNVGEDPLEPQSSFWKSRWFQRGWTLQELIAPAVVRFYDTNWNCLGQKRDLFPALVQITRIPRVFLLDLIPLHEASVAQRMSWAAGRVTKRKEDLAYCMLGIFGITMPMIYGEGDKAFIRLQQEIIWHINDDSILAWNFSKVSSTIKVPTKVLSGGSLASSPLSFADSGHIVSSNGSFESLQTLGGTLVLRRRLYTDSVGQCFVVLQCQPNDQPGRAIGIPVLARTGGCDDYIRLHGHPSILLPVDIPQMGPKDIRILISHSNANDNVIRYSFYIENTLEKELKMLGVVPQSSWIQEKDILIPNEETRSGRLQRLWVMFRHQQDGSGDFVLVLELNLQVLEPQVRHHVMTCDRGTDLVAIKQNFAWVDWCGLNRCSASNGILSLTATVSRERVGRRDIFVVRLLPAKEAPDTYDVAKALQRLKHEREITSAWKRVLRLWPLNALIDKKRRNLHSTQRRLTELQEKIAALQEEHQHLLQVEKAASIELAGLNSQCHKLERLQTRQEWFDKEFADVKVAGSSSSSSKVLFGKWTTPESTRKYHQLESPETFLLEALRLGYKAPFRQLAKQGIDINTISTKDGISLLAYAAMWPYKQIVQTLLLLGADVDGADKGSFSALHWACMKGDVDIVRLLIEYGADIDRCVPRGWTPLMLAAQNNRVDVVRVLIEGGAEIEKTDSDGLTALSIAAEKGYADVVRNLIGYGACLDGSLKAAARIGQLNVVKQLIDAGADRSATDDGGRTPRDWAQLKGHEAIVELLGVPDTPW
ncbi:ankyrin repeat-containing domain protein [Xylaria scruposa]|nr:ankyrin repeat-containing domain protein [Xylaria scruposa]